MFIKIIIFGVCLIHHKVSGSFHYANSGEHDRERSGNFHEYQDVLDEYFEADRQDINKWKARTIAQASSTCDSLDFVNITANLQGVDQTISMVVDDVTFNWYQASCCCRSRGMQLATVLNAADAQALYEATQLASISWVDANSFSGGWKSFLKDEQISEDAFISQIYPEIGSNDQCGHLEKRANGDSFEVGGSKCITPLEGKFVCVDTPENLKDDCFNDWQGKGKFAPCGQHTLVDYANHRVCPELATPSSCDALTFNEIELNDGRIGFVSHGASSFHWYSAECCCRSKGWHLVSVTNDADLSALYNATKDGGEISWVDANTFSGGWKSFLTETGIDASVFTDQQLPDQSPDNCGEIVVKEEKYEIRAVPCSQQDSDRIVCEQRIEKLNNDCFSKWEGTKRFSSCNKHSLTDFGKSRKCPLKGSQTHCESLEFTQVSVTKDGEQINGHISQNAEDLNWFGAFCCCRSRGWNLPEVLKQSDLDSIYQATISDGTAGWTDTNTLLHEWTSFFNGTTFDQSLFDNGIKIPSAEARCGQLTDQDGTYKLKDVACSLKESRNLFCEENSIELPDNCFMNWEGDATFLSCTQPAVAEFAEKRVCPKIPGPTTTTTVRTTTAVRKPITRKPTTERVTKKAIKYYMPGHGGPWGLPLLNPWGPYAPGCVGCLPGSKLAKCAACPGVTDSGSGCGSCSGQSGGAGCSGCGGGGKKNFAGSSGSIGQQPFKYNSMAEHIHNAPVNMFSFLNGR